MNIADEGYKKFIEENGQAKLTCYPLHSRSVVFEVGGYRGQWVSDLLDRCNIICPHCEMRIDPIVHIFEPIKQFAASCTERFRDYPRVHVHNFGLSNTDKTEEIVVDEAASCLHGPCPWRPNDPKMKEHVDLRDIDRFMSENQIKFVELMNINCEGEEYALLHRLITCGAIQRVRHLQVQFHEFISRSQKQRDWIRERLAETHVENFNYPFVWESWTLKS